MRFRRPSTGNLLLAATLVSLKLLDALTVGWATVVVLYISCSIGSEVASRAVARNLNKQFEDWKLRKGL